eukprot:TRINITY_DN1921_c0_g2_i1.p1 TRINITY_DN1921_c0_g2~~TRINITY_DN1921_c0_g2_i1.p1  ORF type:complete len:256 (-),score=50.21 TRINITY_DN1921_c0_g2_i1:62-829(-)
MSGLAEMQTFITTDAVHSIQHLYVLDDADQGRTHEQDKSVPAGDVQQRAQCRTLHQRAVKVIEECGVSWIAGERESLPDELNSHGLTVTGPSGGYSPIHRHGFAVANVCCTGTKEYLFSPSQPLHPVKGSAGDELARDTNSRLIGAAHLANMAKQGTGRVFKAALKADDGDAPNVIVWPPGCYHEVYTPGPYAGLNFYTVPPSTKLLLETLIWNHSEVCQVWADELKSAGVGKDTLDEWFERACMSVQTAAALLQ